MYKLNGVSKTLQSAAFVVDTFSDYNTRRK